MGKAPFGRATMSQRMLEVHDAGELVRIYEEDVALLWWQRAVHPEAVRLLEHDLFSWSREVSGEAELRGLEELAGPGGVLQEIRELIDLQRALFEVDSVGLRVALTDAPMCPGFHVDKVHCRLITTLAGEGTHWRSGSLSAGGHFETLPTGAVGWFKGTAWPGAAARAVVHRSPPGQQRHLVLTMDLL